MPNGKGYYDMQQPMSKTQPGKPGGHKAQENGDGHDFNTKGKIASNEESCYHDLGPGSGSYGNFAEKDAQLTYLKERNKQGQEVNQYSATSRESRMKTGNVGLTAYNSKPIPEVYAPATSQDEPDANAVEYKTDLKDRG